MLRGMLEGMGQSVRNLEGGVDGEHALLAVLARVKNQGELDGQDGGYYSSTFPHRKGKSRRPEGWEAGNVPVARSLWVWLVPEDLLHVYRDGVEWGDKRVQK